jgi:hypothetical protein
VVRTSGNYIALASGSCNIISTGPYHDPWAVCIFSRDQQPNLNTISFSGEGVIPIKPVLNHHAVVSGLDQLYSYDHNEKIRKIL